MQKTPLQFLSDHAGQLDDSGLWPTAQLAVIQKSGHLRRGIPESFGGLPVSSRELLEEYEQLAAACLVTTFILTQRMAACQRLIASDNEPLKQRLLPGIARGDLFTTVGISHLTTSRQHLQTPSVQAELIGDQVHLNGSIPWVTGAAEADVIVTGGTCDDGRQILVALRTDLEGVIVGPAARLLALTASQTATVQLTNVVLPISALLAGPMNNVIAQLSSGGTGSLTTSALALGVSQRVSRLIRDQAGHRPDLVDVSRRFDAELISLHHDLYHAAELRESVPERLTATAIRQRANSLALRISQAALGISKGAGYVCGHPAERAVREALFFLVWSCPQPVVQGVLDELACRGGLGD